MKYRTLGGRLQVSALGIGCMSMVRDGNITYGLADDRESVRTIHRAIDLGVNFFDTAEIYGPHSNETLLGSAIRGRRDGLVIATKFARRWVDGRPAGFDGSPENARRACEGSLKRLGIDVIDLFYLHRVDPDTPIEETVGGMADLVHAGKVRYLGLSEVDADTLRRATKIHPITALQSEYSIAKRGVEAAILGVCRELGIGFVPFSPLGSGILTGTIRSLDDLPTHDTRRSDARYIPRRLERTLALSEVLGEVAETYGVSRAQVALAWLLAQADDIVPIPGVKRRQTLEDSMAAVQLSLSPADLARLNSVSRPT